MVVQSVRQLESLATFTLGVGAAVLVPSVWARRHAAIEWLQGLAEQLTCRLYPSQWTESEGESGLLHGRNKHDMTPAQLARRQMEDPLIALLLDLVAEASRETTSFKSSHTLLSPSDPTPLATPSAHALSLSLSLSLPLSLSLSLSLLSLSLSRTPKKHKESAP